MWPSNLTLEHNVDNNNKLVQDDVHGRFVDYKHFVVLKVINSMGELKK